MRAFFWARLFLMVKFPFLFGGTFIEGSGLSFVRGVGGEFPFLFGGTFIEGFKIWMLHRKINRFPFLFGGTFIEGLEELKGKPALRRNFPSFSEGLSLRVSAKNEGERYGKISLPFRRDFH